MASGHEFPNRQVPITSPSRSTIPPHTRYSPGRSTLRSAEEQLRDIKEGDTSWQHAHTAFLRESQSLSVPSSSNTDDVLEGESHPKIEPTVRVYLHKVRKTDTLPLILFAYDISANALRKANRLWATDSIQSRRKLYLPVEECAVKPVQCTQPPNSKGIPIENSAPKPNGQSEVYDNDNEWPPRLLSHDLLPGGNGVEDQSEWVMIPGIGAVQIISLPAYKLSHFPTQERNAMERSMSLPAFDAVVAEDKAARDSMDSTASRSSIGGLVEDGIGRIVRFWHENQGKKKWAKIGMDLIEL